MAGQVIVVAHPDDVSAARQAARQAAAAIGFDATATEELALVASELASNLVKHAVGGRLTLLPVAAEGLLGLRIESHDDGPGIADVERALTDGYSTAGSLGYGLGSVLRLMDDFDATSQVGSGTAIVAERWLRAKTPAPVAYPLEYGLATRPAPGESANCDSFIAKLWGGSMLVGIVDGLGHGPAAQEAAETARRFVETHATQPLDEIFRGVARVCHSTRGVVMALARFDLEGSPLDFCEPSTLSLTFASIGNVEARVFHSTSAMDLQIRRGVLGGTAPAALVTRHPWDPRMVLVLHSDGLTTHWRWEDFADLDQQRAAVTAQYLLRKLAKDADDATVVVVQAARSAR